MATAKKRKLGRGLKSMINTPVQVDASPEPVRKDDRAGADQADGNILQHLPVAEITANKWQPRQAFDSDALSALSESIKKAGVMQPVLVRRAANGYELVAGERRLRAAEMAGLEHIRTDFLDFEASFLKHPLHFSAYTESSERI